jgi:pimeloyl-ACP methyl ester carboxylesterase
MPRLQAKNLTVDYIEAGSGMPVIFVPGITEYKEAFLFQLGGLQDSYRVVSYDLRRGLKRASDYTLEALADDLHRLIQALDLHSAVICGHSFGGLVAMQFAARYPELARALILMSAFPNSPAGSAESFLNSISSVEHPLRTSVGTRLRVLAGRVLGRKTTGVLAIEHQVEAILDVAQQAMKTSKTTITQRLNMIKDTDLRPMLPQVVAPTLVVAGSKDSSFFLSCAQELYESIPDATLEVIEGAGHFCFLTRHDQFNAAVDDFLTEHLAEI